MKGLQANIQLICIASKKINSTNDLIISTFKVVVNEIMKLN